METLGFQWHLTNLCNLRCRHCYQSRFQDDFEPTLLFDIAARLVGELEENGCRASMNLTGGEPLLLGEHLFALLRFLDRASPVQEMSIITNGLLVDEKVTARLSAYEKLTVLKVSLDGSCPDTNDAIRGKGVFEKVIRNLHKFRKRSTVQVVLMFTVCKQNLAELEGMFFLSQDLGCDGLMIERFIPEGRGKMMAGEILDSRDWEILTSKLVALTGMEISPWELAPYRAFLVRFKEEVELWGAPCNLGQAFCILPEGTILPCRRFLYPLGNILQEGLFQSIGAASLLGQMTTKDALEGKCRKCSVRDCFGCRALGYALYGNPFAEDVQCFLWD